MRIATNEEQPRQFCQQQEELWLPITFASPKFWMQSMDFALRLTEIKR